jgi:hypothetical protein
VIAPIFLQQPPPFAHEGRAACRELLRVCLARAFSSEVDIGSREENASKQEARAFSSEVDTGSREENASKQEAGASVLIQSEPKL